jgi:acetyl esterase/lipase
MSSRSRSTGELGFVAMVWGAVGAMAVVASIFGALAIAPNWTVNAMAAFGEYSVRSSLPYGEGARRTLDVYRPVRAGRNTPVAVFFYGGGWASGSKEDYKFVGAALARRGVIAIIPDYRIYPEARFPAFLEDAALAVRWSKDNALSLGGDPNRIFLIGHSAGAYLAAMLALDPPWLASVDLHPACDIRGWVALGGPYDLEAAADDPHRAIFASLKDEAAAKPGNFASAAAPPAFLAAGADDSAVDPKNTLDLAQRIREVGGTVQTSIYLGLGHRALIGAFSPIFQFRFHVLDDAMNFILNQSQRRSCDSMHHL